MFKPSNHQKLIFNTFNNTNQNIVVQAAPGSGKTTTLLELLKFVKNPRDAIFFAFNKSIVEELKSRVPDGIKCMTMHSFGYSCLFQYYKETLVLNKNKTYLLGRKICVKWNIDPKKIDFYLFVMQDIYLSYRLTNSKGRDSLNALVDTYGLEIENEKHLDDTYELIQFIKEYDTNNIKSGSRMIDFTDMIYLPITYLDPDKIPKYKDVFIDESQDLSKTQQKLVDLTFKKNSRFVACGDRFQSIFSFLGADMKAFDNFCNKPNTIQLPLSISYRCPRVVVQQANEIYNNIEFFDKNREGEILEGSYKKAIAGDFILCRNNAPLFALFIQFLKDKKKAYLRGTEICEGLIRVLKKVRGCSKQEGFSILNQVLNELEEDLKKEGKKKPRIHPRFKNLNEKVLIISILYDYYYSFSAIEKNLSSMFEEKKIDAPILSTIHKAKGLEADNVFILCSELIPSIYVEQAWEIEQENNLLYVMLTRAKNKIIFINDFDYK